MVPFISENPKFINNPNLENKIHCVAFVIDSSSVEVMSDKILGKMKDLQVRMNQRGKSKTQIYRFYIEASQKIHFIWKLKKYILKTFKSNPI